MAEAAADAISATDEPLASAAAAAPAAADAASLLAPAAVAAAAAALPTAAASTDSLELAEVTLRPGGTTLLPTEPLPAAAAITPYANLVDDDNNSSGDEIAPAISITVKITK
jgi:hypothetical protein